MPDKWSLAGVRVDINDNMFVDGDLTVDGDIKPNGGGETYNVTAAATPKRTFNPASTNTQEIADVLATFMKDMVG